MPASSNANMSSFQTMLTHFSPQNNKQKLGPTPNPFGWLKTQWFTCDIIRSLDAFGEGSSWDLRVRPEPNVFEGRDPTNSRSRLKLFCGVFHNPKYKIPIVRGPLKMGKLNKIICYFVRFWRESGQLYRLEPRRINKIPICFLSMPDRRPLLPSTFGGHAAKLLPNTDFAGHDSCRELCHGWLVRSSKNWGWENWFLIQTLPTFWA